MIFVKITAYNSNQNGPGLLKFESQNVPTPPYRYHRGGGAVMVWFDEKRLLTGPSLNRPSYLNSLVARKRSSTVAPK